eukprot:4989812-Alexandrium_andersonii.AAC.1
MWGEDLAPDSSQQARAALAWERRIWEESSNTYLLGETACEAISLAMEYEQDDLGHLTLLAIGEEYR